MRVLEERWTLRPGKAVAILVAVALGAATAACEGEPPAEEEMPPAEEQMAPAGEQEPAGDEPRVFFEQPEDGQTVTSPVQVVFGSENIEVSAVPDEVETPREGVVHYHLGYDAECLPPGTVIPEADPWIHFGDGSNEIELEIPDPGEYRLSVQAGDDEHRTIEGLCETIDITVEPGG